MSRAAQTAALAVGGVLWAVHGTMTMLKPLGEEVRYSESRGYSLVVDNALFLLYDAPGAAALLLTAWGSLAVARHHQVVRMGRVGTFAVWSAVALGVVSAAGVAFLSDPVFTAGRIAGTLLLGLGLVLSAVSVRGRGGHVPALTVTGLLAIGLLPLWPLVYAVRVLPEWGGVVYFVVFGLAWIWWATNLQKAGPPQHGSEAD